MALGPGRNKHQYSEVPCRCTIGEDHADDGSVISKYFSDDNGNESLSVYDAADIWLSNGQDEDYMFGYTEDELRSAAGLS